MGMAPRSSSPTSLLWAQQLKRENGYLMKRMQDLEAASDKQENRIKSTEAAAKANANSDVAALAKQVHALDSAGINNRLSEMKQEVTSKLEDVQADSEAMTLQIAALQKDEARTEDERRRTLNKDKALLKRIGDVEEGLKKYERSLEQMGRTINGSHFEQIKGQLGDLTRQVRLEGEQMKQLGESISALETANEELTRANERLEAETKKMAEKAAATAPAKTVVTSPIADATADLDATPGAEPEESIPKRRKKKSHKWAGGGADKDIIRQGSGLFDSPTLASSSPPAPDGEEVTVAPKKVLPPKKKPHKPIPPQMRAPKRPADDEDDEPPAKKKKKSHKWSGGGADKEILRAGKGWIEVERTPSREIEADTAEVPAKRPRGRPRKNPTPVWTEEELLTQGRATRHAKEVPVPAAAKKRMPDAAVRRSISQAPGVSDQLERNSKSTVATVSKLTKAYPRPNIFSSPVSSAPSSPKRSDGHVNEITCVQKPKPVVYGNVISSADVASRQAPPQARRQIVQEDDVSPDTSSRIAKEAWT